MEIFATLVYSIPEKLRGLPWLFFVEICQTSCCVKMAMPPDRLEQRIRTMTRSGRSVKPPVRYEPDSDQVMEDDFSEEAESDWGCVEEAQTDDGSGDQQTTDSEQSEFTQSDSDDDSSYQSTSSDSSSSEEADDDTSDTSEDQTAGEEDDDVDDVLEWETLTIDASADDQDL
ncbi:EsV-1-44 [Ectocarpus siliculosus virus 1]|uniref:EsV-1-44 n=1 Tax=Ectocarpus siliculosus virus 1 (isolate New Zealand/Kaikoura/1988) TaxID=654926 RepID=Q8QNM1_ESV1K|nr:EsV-1-44 [Ectocarpus siliculosus virus 1]AAK14470.1 EsV-1-44 [Ectocarpus siliculosus virus 1]